MIIGNKRKKRVPRPINPSMAFEIINQHLKPKNLRVYHRNGIRDFGTKSTIVTLEFEEWPDPKLFENTAKTDDSVAAEKE